MLALLALLVLMAGPGVVSLGAAGGIVYLGHDVLQRRQQKPKSD